MANTLGSLVVNLGLNAAEFTAGLTKAEYQAKQFGEKLGAGLAAAATIASGALLAVAGAASIMAKNVIADAAALDDLSDATGSSVENLSRLANQAKISGTNFETLQGLVLKLTAGMAGADDESSNVGRALRFLGVEAKDPAEALQQVAVALQKYADGTGKAALARDLFGKGGPAFLATLKDIAELQDVAGTTSAKMAAEAEALEKSIRRLSAEGTLFKNLILGEIVPALNRWIEGFHAARAAGLGFFAALELGTTYDDQVVNRLDRTKKKVAELQEQMAYSQRRGFGAENIQPKLDQALKEVEALQRIQAARMKALTTSLGLDLPDSRPTANYTGSKDDKVKTAGVDEFARAMETVAKQTATARAELDALVNGTDKLTQAEKAFIALKADDFFEKLNVPKRAAITLAYENFIAIEKETEAVKKRNEAYDKHLQSLQDQADKETKARQAIAANVADYESQNDALKRQIAIIGQDDLAHQKLAATLEYEHRKREMNKQGVIDLAERAKLDTAYAERLSLLNAQDLANKQLEQTRRNTEFVDALAMSFGNAAEEALVMGATFKDVMAGLEKDLMRVLTRRLVTEPLEAALSSFLSGVGAGSAGAGGASGGANWGAILAKLAMSYFGDTTQGGTYGYARGTDYHPGGWSMVGEHGPEIINVPRGSQIIPNDRVQNMRGGDTFVVNVPVGASRMTIDQTIGQLSRAQMRASRSA